MRYIALLRGINVGGHLIKMADLKARFEEIGLKDVKTFIQTGNVFFNAEGDEETLARKIENHLSQALGYDVPTCLRTVEEFRTVIENAPYKDQTPSADERYCVVFTSQKLPPLTTPQTAPKGDMELVAVSEREAFVTWKIINGRPPSSQSNTWLNNLLGSPGTSRFYHTAEKILAAAD